MPRIRCILSGKLNDARGGFITVFCNFVFLYEIFLNKSLKILFITMKQDLKYNPQLFAPRHSDYKSMCRDGALLTLICE